MSAKEIEKAEKCVNCRLTRKEVATLKLRGYTEDAQCWHGWAHTWPSEKTGELDGPAIEQALRKWGANERFSADSPSVHYSADERAARAELLRLAIGRLVELETKWAATRDRLDEESEKAEAAEALLAARAEQLKELEKYAKEGWDWLGEALDALGVEDVFGIAGAKTRALTDSDLKRLHAIAKDLDLHYRSIPTVEMESDAAFLRSLAPEAERS